MLISYHTFIRNSNISIRVIINSYWMQIPEYAILYIPVYNGVNLMKIKKETTHILCAGLIIGVIAVLLVMLGNPINMGFCIACFLRDISGALGMHRAAAVQYIRPEIIGLVLGSMLMAIRHKEFLPRGGSSSLTRFVIAFFVMIGCLMFLGCPFRMILRLAGGDGNALFGLLGFVCGILCGVFFLNRGYTLKRTYKLSASEGVLLPAVMLVLLALLLIAPSFIFFTEAGGGPGANHAGVLFSLLAGLSVGALAQRTRLCMVGGIRDVVLFREFKFLLGFAAVFAAALIGNLCLGMFSPSFAGQPVAHTDGLWNAMGMLLCGFGCVLLGGCPLRQLVLAGEGNSDSSITVIGLMVGAAFAHNFGLASSGAGPTLNGKIAVVVGLIVIAAIACANTFRKEN